MPADSIVVAHEQNHRTRRSSRSWWPYLLSSVVHLSAFAAFLQFGGDRGGAGTGPQSGETTWIVGDFLEADEEGGGDGGTDINLTASIADTAIEADEPAESVEEPEQPPAPQEQEPEPTPPAPQRPRLRAVQTAAHIADTELEPPPAEPRDVTVIEEPPPRSRQAAGSSNRARSSRGTGRGGGSGQGGIGQGTGGEGSGGGAGFFGLEARARTVVYVIDASSSMETHAAMAQAVAELEASLDALPPTARFGIVFFNNVPSMLPASGSPQPMANTPRNQRIARQFISGVVPDAGSDRLSALQAALVIKPDAIFLLTDAGDPPLDAADLEAFRRRNRGGAAVHVIEFGVGVQLVRENFLTRLARQSGGGYRYVDVTGANDE